MKATEIQIRDKQQAHTQFIWVSLFCFVFSQLFSPQNGRRKMENQKLTIVFVRKHNKPKFSTKTFFCVSCWPTTTKSHGKKHENFHTDFQPRKIIRVFRSSIVGFTTYFRAIINQTSWCVRVKGLFCLRQ